MGQTMQLNVRIDADVKRGAEQVLDLMGYSLTAFVRKVFEKVAQGAESYRQVAEVLEERVVDDESAPGALLSAGWSYVDDYYRGLGYDPSTTCEQDVALAEDASWKKCYEEALVAHFKEKGVML